MNHEIRWNQNFAALYSPGCSLGEGELKAVQTALDRSKGQAFVKRKIGGQIGAPLSKGMGTAIHRVHTLLQDTILCPKPFNRGR